MSVDIATGIHIERPVERVYAYTADPTNAPEWYDNIASVAWVGDRRLEEGASVTFVASFLGRRLEYTYELVEVEPNRRLVMRTAQGPFPMETTYEFETSGAGTEVRLRNRGEPAGFSRLVAPFMAPAMRRANRNDLRKLKAILET